MVLQRSREVGRTPVLYLMGSDTCVGARAPGNIVRVMDNFFFSFKPLRHLKELFFSVCSRVCVLCEVNVKPLRCFGVKIVRGAENLDRTYIVQKRVQFRNIKIIPNAEVDKYELVFMEIVQRSLEILEGGGGVHGVLSEI